MSEEEFESALPLLPPLVRQPPTGCTSVAASAAARRRAPRAVSVDLLPLTRPPPPR